MKRYVLRTRDEVKDMIDPRIDFSENDTKGTAKWFVVDTEREPEYLIGGWDSREHATNYLNHVNGPRKKGTRLVI